MPQNAAIYYEPEGFSTNQPRLMGRHAATEGFLTGFVRHARIDRLCCYARAEPLARDFLNRVRAMGATAPVQWISFAQPEKLADPGCLMRPDANLGDLAWRRRRGDQRAYSLCGLTHTTAGRTLEALAELVTAPFQDWDALICTSSVVRATVHAVVEERTGYLRDRLGAARFPVPQFPVIPLGIDTAAFSATPQARAAWRQRLGIGNDDIAVLFVGRLSFHAKANPMPMYLGLERAVRRTGRTVHLIQAGWFANESLEQAFHDGAAALCPTVRHHVIDGRRPEVRREIWSAADIFTSLSDNMQETFGLTPIEAMAAGLPVVVSDWDGYRDTVRDGIDGFRVPTLMPPAGLGADFADLHAAGLDSYDRFCGYISQFIAVDTGACADAYARLIEDADLRRRMGEAGRTRARQDYDWSVIIGRYQELRSDLAARRRTSGESAANRPGHQPCPHHPDPFAAFASYPSSVIGPDHRVALTEDGSPATLAARSALGLNSFALQRMLPPDEAEHVLDHLAATGPCRVDDLLSLVPPARRGVLIRGLVWLCKLDILRITAPETAQP